LFSRGLKTSLKCPVVHRLMGGRLVRRGQALFRHLMTIYSESKNALPKYMGRYDYFQEKLEPSPSLERIDMRSVPPAYLE